MIVNNFSFDIVKRLRKSMRKHGIEGNENTMNGKHLASFFFFFKKKVIINLVVNRTWCD